MHEIKTSIIPVHQEFVKIPNKPHQIDHKAVCVFAAIGFFLETDTYWHDIKVLKPGTINKIDANGFLQSSAPWFRWYYKPRKVSFTEALDEFTTLFETIVKDQTQEQDVILPISGGLDSRTQAVALNKLSNKVTAYSYEFSNGYPETKIASKIAKACDFKFESFTINKGYLWDNIDKLANINKCYSEFTHPRQMAILDELKNMNGTFSLGHWGDVLFDKVTDNQLTPAEEVDFVVEKILKKGGLDLANLLWHTFEIEGQFIDYLKKRVQNLLAKIEITHSGAKIRAFKSLYWAPRWTSVSLNYFKAAHPIQLPYYDERMCRFICELPEEYLADRKLQIAYIKSQNPKVAVIPWQEHMPYNLYNYHKNKSPHNIPYRISNKIKQETMSLLGKKYIQRNWELQFLGEENDENLRSYLYQSEFLNFVGKDLVDTIYKKFKTEDAVFYSHAVSMLLTLSVWNSELRYK